MSFNTTTTPSLYFAYALSGNYLNEENYEVFVHGRKLNRGISGSSETVTLI